MHALLVKVRIEVNSFLFHEKSKHTMSYCVQVSYQVPCGQTLKYFATFLHVSCFAAYNLCCASFLKALCKLLGHETTM